MAGAGRGRSAPHGASLFQPPADPRCRHVPSDPEEVVRPGAAREVRAHPGPCTRVAARLGLGSMRGCDVHSVDHHGHFLVWAGLSLICPMVPSPAPVQVDPGHGTYVST